MTAGFVAAAAVASAAAAAVVVVAGVVASILALGWVLTLPPRRGQRSQEPVLLPCEWNWPWLPKAG